MIVPVLRSLSRLGNREGGGGMVSHVGPGVRDPTACGACQGRQSCDHARNRCLSDVAGVEGLATMSQ